MNAKFEEQLQHQLRDETDCPYSFCGEAALEIVRLRKIIRDLVKAIEHEPDIAVHGAFKTAQREVR